MGLKRRVRLAFAEQELYQGGFADAVGTDDAHLVPAQDHGAQIADNGIVPVSERDLFRLDDHLAVALRLLQRHLRPPRHFEAGSFLLTHLEQRPDPSFVPSSTRFDPTPYPHLFSRQLFVELGPSFRLVLQCFFLSYQIGLIVSRQAGEPAPVQLHDAGGHLLQKHPIMADKKSKDPEFVCPVGKFFVDLDTIFSRKSTFSKHMTQSRIEFLKAIRSLVDERIEGLEKKHSQKGKKRMTKIKVE